MKTEGIQKMKYRATNFQGLGIIFRMTKSTKKNFLPASSFHRCSNGQLEGVQNAISRSNYSTEN